MGVNPTKVPWVDDSPPTLNARDLNDIKSEINDLITSSGETLSNTPNQQKESVAIYAAAGDFYDGASGVANTYIANVIGPRAAPSAYFDGMRIRFVVPATNTGVPVTVNAATIGVVGVLLPDLVSDPVAGDMFAGEEIEMVFKLSAGKFIITTTVRSVIDAAIPPIPVVASVAQMIASVDDSTFVSPTKVLQSPFAAKALILFDGTIPGSGSAQTILKSVEVSAVTRVGVANGIYDITLINPFTSVDYFVDSLNGSVIGPSLDNYLTYQTISTSVCRIFSRNPDGTLENSDKISVKFFGEI